MKYLDIDNWKRKNQFLFFKDYDNPFYNICTEVDITECHRISNKENLSFFLTSLYLSVKAANALEEFRSRIRGDKVVVHDIIHPSSTVMNDSGTFNFCNFTYRDNFNDFYLEAQECIRKTLANQGELEAKPESDDLIHYSVIPWISFNSVSNARRFDKKDSIPKIILGKFFEKGDKLMLPISIEVHHSLVDGFHIARYLELFQRYSNDSEKILTTPLKS